MSARVLADLVVVVHLAFIVFVVGGGILALRWRWMPWLHLPAVLWAVLLELGGLPCPLTPLENWLRARGGASPYAGGFVDRYLVPVVYPEALTRDWQIALGVLVCAVNAAAYAVVRQVRRSKAPCDR